MLGEPFASQPFGSQFVFCHWCLGPPSGLYCPVLNKYKWEKCDDNAMPIDIDMRYWILMITTFTSTDDLCQKSAVQTISEFTKCERLKIVLTCCVAWSVWPLRSGQIRGDLWSCRRHARNTAVISIKWESQNVLTRRHKRIRWRESQMSDTNVNLWLCSPSGSILEQKS